MNHTLYFKIREVHSNNPEIPYFKAKENIFMCTYNFIRTYILTMIQMPRKK